MKQIVAVVRPHVTEKVLAVIQNLPFLGSCTVREVKGYGRQKSYLSEYRGSEYSTAFLPKVQICFYTEDTDVDFCTSLIIEAARSGRIGDGKIFVASGNGEIF